MASSPGGQLDSAPESSGENLDAAMAGSAYARASGMSADPMASYALADRWMAAGQALATSWPTSARRALLRSAWFFRRDHADWTVHLPASRWDPDGREGFEAADALRAPLITAPDAASQLEPGDRRWT